MAASTKTLKEESKTTLPVDIVESTCEDTGLEEMVIGKGIGNALKIMRERGLLGRDTVRGRTKDETLNNQLGQFNKEHDGSQKDDEVKLQYFDK